MAEVPTGSFEHALEEIDAAVSEVESTKGTETTLTAAIEEIAGTLATTAAQSAVSTAIGALDVESIGGTGKYIKSISETDGVISATAETMDTTPTANSDNPVKSGGIKTYVDTAVSGLIGINDVYGLGTTIPDNADIDVDPYLAPGVHIRTSNQNSSIHGIPVNGYAFKLIVEYINSNIRRRQIFIPLSATAEYYIRIYNSSGWQAWYKFEGTAVT